MLSGAVLYRLTASFISFFVADPPPGLIALQGCVRRNRFPVVLRQDIAEIHFLGRLVVAGGTDLAMMISTSPSDARRRFGSGQPRAGLD